MKESLHWNEKDLARILRDAQDRLREEDWAAMEALLDRTGEGQAPPPEPGGIPGPAAGLPDQWAGWLFGGLLSGLLLLFVPAAMPAHRVGSPSQPAGYPGIPSEPVRDVASIDGAIGAPAIADAGLPGNTADSRRAEESVLAGAKESPSPREGGPAQGPPAQSGHDLAGHTGGTASQPVVAPFASPEAPAARPEFRTAAKDFHELPEDAYNIGLVAVSRLRKPLRQPVSESLLALPGQAAPGAITTPRWRIGLAGGVQMGTSPFDRTAPVSPWMGMQVRYDLGGAWYLQSGISAKWLDRKGFYGAEDPNFQTGMSGQEMVFLRKAEGLLVWELPILAGWQLGRWFATGGARLAVAMTPGARQGLSAEEFQTYRLQGDLAESPNNPDLGLALGAGYFLHPALAVELRYHHGLGVFLPAGAQDLIREVRHRDLQLGLAWWPGR